MTLLVEDFNSLNPLYSRELYKQSSAFLENLLSRPSCRYSSITSVIMTAVVDSSPGKPTLYLYCASMAFRDDQNLTWDYIADVLGEVSVARCMRLKKRFPTATGKEIVDTLVATWGNFEEAVENLSKKEAEAPAKVAIGPNNTPTTHSTEANTPSSASTSGTTHGNGVIPRLTVSTRTRTAKKSKESAAHVRSKVLKPAAKARSSTKKNINGKVSKRSPPRTAPPFTTKDSLQKRVKQPDPNDKFVEKVDLALRHFPQYSRDACEKVLKDCGGDFHEFIEALKNGH